jgi:hypothetical protein
VFPLIHVPLLVFFPYFQSRQDQMKDGVWEEMDEAFTAVKKRRLELQTM